MQRYSNRRVMWSAVIATAVCFYDAGAIELDLSNLTIGLSQIQSGGPAKDGIPSLTDPSVVPASEAHFLRPGELVLGVSVGGQSRAYPLKILNWHEAANDVLGGKPIVATW